MSCPTIEQLRSLLDATAGDARAIELQLHLESCEACQKSLDGLVADRGFWNDAAKQLADKPSITPALEEVVEHLQEARGIGFQPVDSAEIKSGVEVPVAGGRKNDRQEAYPTKDDRQDAYPTEGRPLDYYEHALPFVGPPVEPGTIGRLKHYDILHVAGRGGMGVVVKAFDRALRRVVAIKLLAPHLASNGLARQRFVREGRATAAIAHEHVVTIHAVEEQPPFLVMQYVQGETLQARLDRCGPLELKEVLRTGKQIAEGLAAAHEQGVVHRDIKPANILLENGISRVKLTDFGLARAMDDASLTHSGVVAGTPQFMAPEQANGDAIDHRADLFSLGSVLYTMCVGHAPFRGSTAMGVLRRVAEHPARPIRDINPEIPEWLAALINRLHAKRPEDRPQSALEVADELGRRLASLQSSAAVATPSEKRRMGTLARLPEESVVTSQPGAVTVPTTRPHDGQEWPSSNAAMSVTKPTGFVMPDRLTLVVLTLVIAATVLVAAGTLGREASEVASLGVIGAALLGLIVLGLRRWLTPRCRDIAPRGVGGWLIWIVAWLGPAAIAVGVTQFQLSEFSYALQRNADIDIEASFRGERSIATGVVVVAVLVYACVASLWFRRRRADGSPLYTKPQRWRGCLKTCVFLLVAVLIGFVDWFEHSRAIATARRHELHAVAQQRAAQEEASQAAPPFKSEPDHREREPQPAAFAPPKATRLISFDVVFPREDIELKVSLSNANGEVGLSFSGDSLTNGGKLPAGKWFWTATYGGRSYAKGDFVLTHAGQGKRFEFKVPDIQLAKLLQGRWRRDMVDNDGFNIQGRVDIVGDELLLAWAHLRAPHAWLRERWKIKLDESTSPASVDLTDEKGRQKRGIADLSRGYLSLVFATGDDLRPVSFEMDANLTERWLLTTVAELDAKRLVDELPPEPIHKDSTLEVVAARQSEQAKRLNLQSQRVNPVGIKIILFPEFEFAMNESRSETTPQVRKLPGWEPLAVTKLTQPETPPDPEPVDSNVTRSQLVLPKKVGPLAVASAPITVRQFAQFVRETKYVTDAERNNAGSWLLGDDGKLSLKPKTYWRSLTSPADAELPLTLRDENAADFASPVSHVSWNDAKAFCEWLSQKVGRQYRLPKVDELRALSELTVSLKSRDNPLAPPESPVDPFLNPDRNALSQPTSQIVPLLDLVWLPRTTKSPQPLKPLLEVTESDRREALLEAEWTHDFSADIDKTRLIVGLGTTTVGEATKLQFEPLQAETTFRCERLGFRVVAEIWALREDEALK